MISLTLSKKRHLPVLKYEGGTYAFWDLPKLLFGERTTFLDQKFISTVKYVKICESELSEWYKWYLPISLEGKRVLDVGSGCGETILFFLKNGASHVTGIEVNKKACYFARKNLKEKNAKIIAETFSLKHLSLPHDFIKMDIEGAERELLKLEYLPRPSVIEVHGLDLIHSFLQRMPDRTFPITKNVSLMWFLKS